MYIACCQNCCQQYVKEGNCYHGKPCYKCPAYKKFMGHWYTGYLLKTTKVKPPKEYQT